MTSNNCNNLQKQDRHILLCLTCESHSEYAFTWLRDKFLTNKDSLYILAVIPACERGKDFFNSCFAATPSSILCSTLLEAHKSHMRECCGRFLRKKQQEIKEKFSQMQIQILLMEGDAKEMVLQVAEDIHPDLVVMGSKNLGKLKRALLGSVSDYCVHHCECPILIIKEPVESNVVNGEMEV